MGAVTGAGIALLWLARGQTEAAAAALHRALDEREPNCGKRAELLGAHVEALIAKGEVAAARDAASELRELAEAHDAVFLHALADRAEGSVLLADGQPGGAVALFRRSWRGWQELEAPYEGARVRVQIANACRVVGDEGSAQMELDAARWVFERLGARFDLDLLDRDSKQPPSTTGRLSARELEVLRLIAAKKSNKEIAAALVISEHTVARHVQNMLQKLGCSSRTGLAAFAVEHGLVRHASG